MNVTMDSQWNHEANNFAMDNNDYEKAFESYISDVDDDDGKSRLLSLEIGLMLLGNHGIDYPFSYVHDSTSFHPILVLPNGWFLHVH